jgi:hypothetical protein
MACAAQMGQRLRLAAAQLVDFVDADPAKVARATPNRRPRPVPATSLPSDGPDRDDFPAVEMMVRLRAVAAAK